MIRLFLLAAIMSGCAAGSRPGSAANPQASRKHEETATASRDSAAAAGRDSAVLEDFLSGLERAVRKHDKPALVALLDPDYKAKQLVRIYKGNPDPFLNTLICGQVVASDQNYCLDFDAIFKLERKNVVREDESARVTYLAESDAHAIETRLKVMLRKGESPGLIGSQGFTQIE
jgi:hypothetical protein